MPDGEFDALMLTSAPGARLAGPGLQKFIDLPVYCVGRSTRAAARTAGFLDIVTERRGALMLAQRMVADGRKRILRIVARDATAIPDYDAEITECVVYAADLGGLTDEAVAALKAGEIDWVLLFSARTAMHFASIWPDRNGLSIAAISPQVLDAAGWGWRDGVCGDDSSEAGTLAAAGLTCDREA